MMEKITKVGVITPGFDVLSRFELLNQALPQVLLIELKVSCLR